MEKKTGAKETKKRGTRKPARPRAKSVSFRLDAPDASAVAVAGDFNGWDPNACPLWYGEGGVWERKVSLSPGVHQYKFVVDGMEWWEDPLNPNRVPNDFGTFNSVCEVA